ncbi:MAG: acyl carrier protein [Acholeplasmatales bacterium]|nr:acyl carrier protein [Acholeplasmatales bacterium]
MEELIKILKEVAPQADVENETDFIEHKVLDSLSIMRLVVMINDEFDVEITPVDMTPENFKSLKTIYEMIQRLED